MTACIWLWPVVYGVATCGFPSDPLPSAVDRDDYGSCGLSSLYAVCKIRGKDVDWHRLKKLLGAGASGVHSFEELRTAAQQVGVDAFGVHVEAEHIPELPMPVIAHVTGWLGSPTPHLVVVLRISPERVDVLDAPFPAEATSFDHFKRHWTGNLLVFPRNAQEAVELRQSLALSARRTRLVWVVCVLAGIVAVLAGLPKIWLQRQKGARDADLFYRAAVRLWHSAVLALKRWPSLLGLASVVVVSAAILWCIPRRVQSQDARLEVEPKTVDLGVVAPGTYPVMLTLRNRGRRELVISKVKTNCSCAVVVNCPKRIAGGESGQLEIDLVAAEGRRSTDISVYSNSDRPAHSIGIQWEAYSRPRLVPPMIYASRVPSGGPYERVVHIVYAAGSSRIEPKVQDMQIGDAPIELSIGESRTRPIHSDFKYLTGELDLRVRVHRPASGRTVAAICTMAIKCGADDYVRWLPVSVDFVDSVFADPDEIVFAGRTLKELVGQKREIRLTVTEPCGELSVQSCPPWLRCSVKDISTSEATLDLEVVDVSSGEIRDGCVFVEASGKPTWVLPIAVRRFVGVGSR